MTKSKKSIIANFGLLATPAPETKSQEPPLSAPLPRVGAGVIGAAQRSIGELRDERDRLKALVESGAGGASTLDPALIDPSPFPDRLPDDGEADYAVFRRMIEEEGQKVPIQVRPHPEAPGRYQAIFGHRRLRAARDLGIPVKAVVVDMSDRDLVVSQGLENAARQDLSWIERALFARRMDDAGIKPRDIKAALAVDDPELARMRAVYRTLPPALIEMIGRAPKIGRPRWVDFAKLYGEHEDSEARVTAAFSANAAASSDARFQLALLALKTPAEKLDSPVQELRSPDGATLGLVTASDKEWRLQAKSRDGTRFAAFLQARLPELVKEFMQQKQ